MATAGKKFRAAEANVDRNRTYTIPDAATLVKKASFAKFDETVDIAVNLGVDPRHADQVVRGTVVLPHGTGKSVRVLVIAQGDRAKDAVDNTPSTLKEGLSKAEAEEIKKKLEDQGATVELK